MAEEYPEEIRLYEHVPNSGIVHLPHRRFPAVAIQGDSLSVLFSEALSFMRKAKEHNDKDFYYIAKNMAERLKGHMERYEAVLDREGFSRPYVVNVGAVDLNKDFEDYS